MTHNYCIARGIILRRLSNELGSHKIQFHGGARLISKIRRAVRRNTELGVLFVKQVGMEH